jgi:hypothetical protein
MSTDPHSSSSCVTHKRTSSTVPLLGWMKARLGDVMVTAEVLHDVQWAAPWDNAQSALRLPD